MKMKSLACILALAMCVLNFTSLPSAKVYAANPSVSVSIGEAEGTPGEEVQVQLVMSDNPGLTCMLVMVGYDSDVLECTGISEKGLFGAGNYIDPPLTDNPLRLNWADGMEERYGNGVLAELTFKIKDTAYNGETPLTLTTEFGNTFNYDLVDHDIKFTDGKVTVKGGSNKYEYEGDIPSAPAVKDITASGFEVIVSSGCEFTYSNSAVSDFTGCTWYEDGTVSGLEANTLYYVYQRVKETDTHKASGVSEAAEATTSKKQLSDIIESVNIGTDGTAGTVLKADITYKTGSSAADAGELSYKWSNGFVTETYTITSEDVVGKKVISVTVSASEAAGTVDSNTVTAGKANYTGTVKTPVIETVSADGFIIKGELGYEYFVSETDTVPSAESVWTTELTVTGLVPGKTYYVFGRVKATDTVNASDISRSTSVRIPSDNAFLKELTVSSGTMLPEFKESVYEYSVVVPYGEDIPSVTAKASDSSANVSVINAADFETANKASVTVTAENKTDIKIYTVTFTQQERTAKPEIVTDNTNSISRVNGVIEIKGNGTVYYTADGTDPTVSSAKYTSSIKISSLNIPLSTASVTIKAAALEEGKALSEIAEKTFILADTDATLSDLAINGTSVSGFSPDMLNYTYDVSYSDWVNNKTVTYTISAIASKATSSVNISENGFVLSNDDSDVASSKKVTIDVTSENGDMTSYVITFNVLACEHSEEYEVVSSEATCNEAGKKEIRCTICEKIIGEEEIPAKGHTKDNGVITVEPTCTKDGVKTFTCTVCLITDTEVVPALGHEFDDEGTIITQATCTADGVRTFSCVRCTEAVTEAIPALGHDFGEGEVTAEPDCINEGVKTFTCSRCSVTETENIPALGHDWAAQAVVIKEASCTEDGISGRQCSRCDNIADKTLIEAAGHSWGSWTQIDEFTYERSCGVCSATESSTVTDNSHVHNFNGTVEIITAPTCTSEGLQYIYCSETGCREYAVESISKIPHTASVVSETPASCTESGSKITVCSICNAEMQNAAVPALGHDYSNGKVSDISGHWDQCARCSERTHTEAHTSNGGRVEGNVIKYSCTICGYVIKTQPYNGSGDFENGDDYNNNNDNDRLEIGIPETNQADGNTSSHAPVISGNFVSGPVEPQIDGDDSCVGWKKILKTIKSSESNEITVDMNTDTVVPEEIISEIAGKDIDLVLKFSYYTWTINGADVREAKDVNLSVSRNRSKIPTDIIEEISNGNDYIQITLAHSGDLGFDAKLTLSVGNKYNGLNANMFYYRKSAKSLEFTDTDVVANGMAEFMFDHASSYAVIFSNDTLGYEDVASDAGIFNNEDGIMFKNANESVCITIALMVVLSASVAVYLKKKRY